VIILTKKGEAIQLDIADWPLVKDWNWYVNQGRARANMRGKRKGTEKLYMAQLIMNPPEGYQVDHENRDPLDNRRCNLRVCLPEENYRNKNVRKDSASGIKGVDKTKAGRFRAQIKHLGKSYHLGVFGTAEEAALAYNKAAIELHGEFACLNNIPKGGDSC
jgi:hypothetical protein